MDRLISLEPSNVVPIRIEPPEACSGELTLRNVMYTMPVAFRLQPLIKSRYTFKPHSGIIPPLATLAVTVVYHLPAGAGLPESFPHSDDSFQLHSVVVPGAAIKEASSSIDSVPSDWFTTKKKQVFVDSGIKVTFVGSAVLARLVADGAMDEIREVLEKSDASWRAVDSVDSNGETLLHLAVAQGRADLVQLLLEFDPDMEKRGGSGSTALEAAAAAGEALIVELLLARGARTGQAEGRGVGPGAIHLAAGGGHVEVLRLLLLKGASVDAVDGDGNTALYLAVEERRRDCARLLLANGANPDVRNAGEGETALHIAARIGDEQMVKLLLQKAANKHIRNYAAHKPYDVAANCGHTRLFDVLRLGDDLCSAARSGDVKSIRRLIQAGAALNGRDQNGWTALHRAAFKGRLDAARSLIDLGAEIDATDDDGYTALHCATEAGHAAVVELLVKNGAAVESPTNRGATPVQIAQSLRYARIVRILIGDGAAGDVTSDLLEVPSPATAWSREGRGGSLKKKQVRSRGRIRTLRSADLDQSLPLSVV